MLRLVLSVSCLALVAGCTSMTSKAEMMNRALAACVDRATEEKRTVCFNNEMAAQAALQEQKRKAAHDAALEREREEALRDAYGVPDGYREIATDNGLRLPQDQ